MSTEQILQLTLDVIRRDGWRANGWAIVPPYCLRAAVTDAVNRSFACGKDRDEANLEARQAISQAIGQPLGLLAYWESRPGRTQTDVEQILEKAITGVHG